MHHVLYARVLCPLWWLMLADLPLRPFNMDESSNQHRLRRKIALDATAAQPCAFLLLLLFYFYFFFFGLI